MIMESEVKYIYPHSEQKRGDCGYRMVKTGENLMLSVTGSDMAMFDGVEIKKGKKPYKLCPLSTDNAKVIRRLFDYTNPKSHKGYNITIGLGDRLGLASPGHIEAIRESDVFPVLAQQSMRELVLTGRNYDDVLTAATWAVFREGYRKGFGADGDHLKTADEVKNALLCGYTMITLDCSEHINNDFTNAAQENVDTLYQKICPDIRKTLEERYLNKVFKISGDIKLTYNDADFRRIVLIYHPAVLHAAEIYNNFIKGTDIDFEVSIDETLSVTTPQAHYFTANELKLQGVDMTSLAPRFPGEFQKGIDYIGDVSEFEKDFMVHARIADTFGYKLSIHSGSDKFSVFPAIGQLTGGRYHLKTAGTSWLEAVRVIARNAPELYREIHIFALKNLDKAKKYYHITENTKRIKDVHSVSDAALPEYLEHDDARRVLHITYALILDGFCNRVYETLKTYEDKYTTALKNHIGRHMEALGIEK